MAGSDEVVSAYANALASLAESQSKLETIHSDMDRLATLIHDNEELTEFFSNPIVGEKSQKDVLTTVCREAEFAQDTQNFLNLILDKGRMNLIHEICQSFEDQYCKLTDTQIATVTSAIQLDEEEQYKIAEKLQELTGAKNVKLKPVLDPAVVGGFKVEYGSCQIDMSVRGQLNRVVDDLRGDTAIA